MTYELFGYLLAREPTLTCVRLFVKLPRNPLNREFLRGKDGSTQKECKKTFRNEVYRPFASVLGI